MVLSYVSRSVSGCSTIAKSYSRAQAPTVAPASAGKVCERLEAVAYARIAGFGFKYRKGGIGPRQRALAFDLKYRPDRCAAVDGEGHICGFIANRDRIQMRAVRLSQRDGALDDRP